MKWNGVSIFGTTTSYYDRVYEPHDASSDGQWRLLVVRVKKQYWVTSTNANHEPDVGPYKTLHAAKAAAETCMLLNEVPASLKKYV